MNDRDLGRHVRAWAQFLWAVWDLIFTTWGAILVFCWMLGWVHFGPPCDPARAKAQTHEPVRIDPSDHPT